MCVMALQVASAVVGALGAYQGAQAQKAQANYQAKVAANNAQVAEWQAQAAEDKGVADAITVGRKASDLRGRQAAAMASNGLSLSDGSPAGILEQTDYFGLEDQRTAAQNAKDEAWGLRQRGANFTAEAAMQRAKAGSISPFMAAGTSLLGSAATVADKWSARNPGKPVTAGAVWDDIWK